LSDTAKTHFESAVLRDGVSVLGGGHIRSLLQPGANGCDGIANAARRKLKALRPLALSVKARQSVFGQIYNGANLRFVQDGMIRQVRRDQRHFSALAGHNSPHA
jgi:hypothetical protein